MNERIRFHLDEHIDPDIARALRRYGIDVTTTAHRARLCKQSLPLAGFGKNILLQPDLAAQSFIA